MQRLIKSFALYRRSADKLSNIGREQGHPSYLSLGEPRGTTTARVDRAQPAEAGAGYSGTGDGDRDRSPCAVCNQGQYNSSAGAAENPGRLAEAEGHALILSQLLP